MIERLDKILERYNDRSDTFASESTIVDLVNFAGEMVKDEEEIEHMRKASLLNDAAMEKIQEVRICSQHIHGIAFVVIYQGGIG